MFTTALVVYSTGVAAIMRLELALCVLLPLVTTWTSPVITRSQGACRTPTGLQGYCVSITKCAPLAAIARRAHHTHEELSYMKKSICNSSKNRESVNRNRTPPKICCPPVSTWPRFEQHIQSKSVRSGVRSNSASKRDGTFTCGFDALTTNKIIGGTTTRPEQYPWLVLLQYNDGMLRCVGSLITSRFVLTAAHCLTKYYDPPVIVRLGEYNISEDAYNTMSLAGGISGMIQAKEVPVEEIYPYRHFVTHIGSPADIGLVKLLSNVEFTDMINVICTPTEDYQKEFGADTKFVVAGWSLDHEDRRKNLVKMDVRVPYVPYDLCSNIYHDVLSPKVRIKKQYQICAGGEENKDTCRGDSGGPLMYKRGWSYIVVGLVSYGPSRCGQKGLPAVYTDVYKYMGWIKATITKSYDDK